MALFVREREAPVGLVEAPMYVTHTPEVRETRQLETRDPRAATASLQYHNVGTPMVQEWDALAAIRWGYIANTYVFRCVDVISTVIATCPFRAVNPANESQVSFSAPLAKLLGPPPGGPNPALSPRRLWKWTVAQRLITGRWCWEKERVSQEATSGRVIGLWPIAAHLIDPVPSNGGRHYFDSFVYNQAGTNKKTFKPSQLVYDWNPSQGDFRQAESVLQAARLDISVAVMQDRYDVAFLKNDARPAAVIVHEEFAEKDEREAFRQQFLADYRGVDNAGRPIFIEASPGEEEISKTFHIERLGLSQKDAEFISRYETKIRAICVAFGTPLSILGDSSARSFDNAGQEYRNWWESTLLPLMAELEDAVNMQLAPDLGREIGKFETTHVAALMKNSKILALGGAISQFVAGGIITPDEVRSELDLEEMGGDAAELTSQEPAPELTQGKETLALPAGRDAVANPREKDNNEDPQRSQGRSADLGAWEVRDRVRVLTDENGVITLQRLEDNLEVRGDKQGHPFRGNQHNGDGSAAPSYRVEMGEGGLPAGVKPTVPGIRAAVRRVVIASGGLEEKKQHLTQAFANPRDRISIGHTRHTTGTTIRVTPIRNGATVHISQIAKGQKDAVLTGLRDAGFKIGEQGESYTPIMFNVYAPPGQEFG